MNMTPENMAINSDENPALVILDSRFSVISSGANNAFNYVIFLVFRRLSCINANKEIMAPVHNNP